ncbi:MAG TPA: hypothetical protein VH309_13980, partial [Elusimicrobiota bacterium]|nr:hypothetical protein [Elusimicrobiota bacterium]
MATSTRRSFAWLSAFLLAAPALPALAQTRVAVSADGAAVPAAAVAGAAAPGMGAGTGVAPISFAAPSLAAVPSAPSAAISRPAESGAVAAGPAASVAVPALGASPAVSRAALASLPVLTSPVEAAAAPARAAVAVAHRVAAHETAAASISASRPETAREAAALALVAGETAGWETRSAQTLGAAPVLGAASEGTGPLARPTARTAAPEPAAPAPSKVKAVVKWAWPIALLTALVTALDFGTKLFATKHLFTVFHEVAWRTPFLMAIIPYIIFTAYKARSSLPNDHKVWHWSPKQLRNGRFGFFQDGVSGMTAMVKDHPSLRW